MTLLTLLVVANEHLLAKGGTRGHRARGLQRVFGILLTRGAGAGVAIKRKAAAGNHAGHGDDAASAADVSASAPTVRGGPAAASLCAPLRVPILPNKHSTRDGHHARVGRVVVGPERGLGLHESGHRMRGQVRAVRRLHLAKLRLESARSLRGPGRWIRAQAHVGG